MALTLKGISRSRDAAYELDDTVRRPRARAGPMASGRHSDVPRRRRVEQFEFRPPTSAEVLDWMGILTRAHDGWINLLPGVPEEEVEAPTRSVFSALFGTAQPAVSMCTWMPPGEVRGTATEQTIGILHPRGRFAASQLAELGVPVPSSWRVSQDHAKRGLIIHAPAGAPGHEVLDWMLRAGAVLAVIPLTGTWQARVFQPRSAPAPPERPITS